MYVYLLVYYSIYVCTLMYMDGIYTGIYIYIYICVYHARIDSRAIHIPMFLHGFPMYEHPGNTHIIAFAMNIFAFTLN